MTRSSAARDERIELRATKEEKRLLTKAAAEERLDVTSFILRSAIPTARDIIARSQRVVLSSHDSERILDLLEHPPKPTRTLLAAARGRGRIR